MGFTTLSCSMPERALRSVRAVLVWACILIVTALVPRPVLAQNVQIDQFQLHKSEEGLQLSANLLFDLPKHVEDALKKGISVVFSTQGEVVKERWYWYDKQVSTVHRSHKLSFQPLTGKWRLQTTGGSAQLETGLAQTYDSLGPALAAIKRVHRLKLADWQDIDTDTKYTIDFKFRLDTTQLPRPFQLGAAQSSDWAMSASKSVRFVHDGKTETSR